MQENEGLHTEIKALYEQGNIALGEPSVREDELSDSLK